MTAKTKNIIDAYGIMHLLDLCYQKAVNGVEFVSPPIEVMADNYLQKYSTPSIAAKKMISNQILKCTTSGFITGFGGAITLPVTVPANISSVIYVQMRMIACTAYMAGYDLHCDQVQSLVYACLAGVAVNSVFKKTGIKLGEKMAVSVIQKIPRNVITRINQRVGFRFITKFGEKGLINLGKLVPGVGALINGGFDFAETKVIANRSYRWFFEGDFSVDEQNTHQEDEQNILDIDDFSEA